jgi:hypothetical protein
MCLKRLLLTFACVSSIVAGKEISDILIHSVAKQMAGKHFIYDYQNIIYLSLIFSFFHFPVL